MFNKFEMIGAIAISLFGGIAIGYSKAREKCLEAIINATRNAEKPKETKEEEP